MNEATTSNISDAGGKLTLESILEFQRRIKAMPPVARQIYFVDRWEAYCKLRNMTEKTEVEQRAIMAMPTPGIPIIVLNYKDNVPGLPKTYMPPGIWAAMSDGTFQKLDKQTPLGADETVKASSARIDQATPEAHGASTATDGAASAVLVQASNCGDPGGPNGEIPADATEARAKASILSFT